MLYGRDPQLPTDSVLHQSPVCTAIHLNDYKTLLSPRMFDAWESATNLLKKAQNRPRDFAIGERVFV